MPAAGQCLCARSEFCTSTASKWPQLLTLTCSPLTCRPMDFENINVLHQLRCGGVLEAVRISCAGYPTKTPYEDFVDHFWNLVPELLSNQELDDVALSKAVLKKANLVGYQCGQTKVRGMPSPAVPICIELCRTGHVTASQCCPEGRSLSCASAETPGCRCTATNPAHPCGSDPSKAMAGLRSGACPQSRCRTQCRFTAVDQGCLLSGRSAVPS